VEGAGASLSAEDSSQWYMAINTGTELGSVTLRSDIDETTLTMAIHGEADIDGIEEPHAGVLEDIDVGDTNPFYVRPMVGDLIVCQGDTQKSVRALTPEICAVRDTERPDEADDDGASEYGWFEIEGLKEGTCEYEVTFVKAAGGAGVSHTFSYTIEP